MYIVLTTFFLIKISRLNDILLCDGGYACKQYLLTPWSNEQNPAEIAYGRAHVVNRTTVERSFGQWKDIVLCEGIFRCWKEILLRIQNTRTLDLRSRPCIPGCNQSARRNSATLSERLRLRQQIFTKHSLWTVTFCVLIITNEILL